LNAIYRAIGISRQGVHKLLNTRLLKRELEANLSVIISQIREDHPTMSLRAMYHKIEPEGIGRDAFESMAKGLGFKVCLKRNGARTTDSSGVIRFPDLLKDLKLTHMNQAYCSDITYFEVNDRFYYLTFIMDCYSRKIVGYSVSDNLYTEYTTLPALRQAIRGCRGQLIKGLVLHSDGGGQYYDKNFLILTKQHGILNSMCEMAYENGKAERLNGIIKNNYLKHWKINDFSELKKQVDRAVRLYNTEKPHKSIGYQTPVEFELEVLNLQQQTKPMMTKSFDAERKINRASSPVLS
jgi:putative transposase